ncbi:uncharacterized protein LOC131247039 [Magnolia sinica]|uniref:uncharacterized protein LOC131247039 n=1 Tax=Magnolia sinica TaxID=86752 RepID=UPI0026584801|nr:uncharacterized protein LOC131247039 [Magnolia sinica]
MVARVVESSTGSHGLMNMKHQQQQQQQQQHEVKGKRENKQDGVVLHCNKGKSSKFKRSSINGEEDATSSAILFLASTRSTRAHPAPAIEDPALEVLILPLVVPISPPEPAVPVSEAPALSAAPVPPPEASAALAHPTVLVGVEHFQQMMQAVTAIL